MEKYIPTKKMTAVMIAAAATYVVKLAIEAYMPGVATAEMYQNFNEMIQLIVIAASGYMTTETRPVPPA
jgi:hypothetical protein